MIDAYEAVVGEVGTLDEEVVDEGDGLGDGSDRAVWSEIPSLHLNDLSETHNELGVAGS